MSKWEIALRIVGTRDHEGLTGKVSFAVPDKPFRFDSVEGWDEVMRVKTPMSLVQALRVYAAFLDVTKDDAE